MKKISFYVVFFVRLEDNHFKEIIFQRILIVLLFIFIGLVFFNNFFAKTGEICLPFARPYGIGYM